MEFILYSMTIYKTISVLLQIDLLLTKMLTIISINLVSEDFMLLSKYLEQQEVLLHTFYMFSHLIN